jgi:hypothetical protein
MEETRPDSPTGITDTLKGGAGDAAGTVKQEVAAATTQVADQARTLLDQSKTQVRDEARAQSEKLAGSLRQMGTQFQALAEGRPQEAGPVGDYARQAAEGLARYADSLQSKGVDGVLQDAQHFARRRPGTFLLGAAVAGVVVGRLVRNAKGDAVQGQQQLAAPQPSDRLTTYPEVTTQAGSFEGTDRNGTWTQTDRAWSGA